MYSATRHNQRHQPLQEIPQSLNLLKPQPQQFGISGQRSHFANCGEQLPIIHGRIVDDVR